MIIEVVWQRREERIKSKRRGWGVICTPSLVSRGGVESGYNRYSDVRAYIFMLSFTGKIGIDISQRDTGNNTNRVWRDAVGIEER